MSGEDKLVHKGRVVFGAMDEVVFGRHASEALPEANWTGWARHARS